MELHEHSQSVARDVVQSLAVDDQTFHVLGQLLFDRGAQLVTAHGVELPVQLDQDDLVGSDAFDFGSQSSWPPPCDDLRRTRNVVPPPLVLLSRDIGRSLPDFIIESFVAIVFTRNRERYDIVVHRLDRDLAIQQERLVSIK